MQVPSFSAQTLLQPAVYAGLPCSFALQALFFFGARRAWPSAFTTSAQTSWILTTMSSIVMTTASLPFVVDYFAHDTDLSAMPLLNSPWAVAVSMYFISYLVCDLAIGYVYYKDQIDMVTGWLHHLIYPIVLLAVVLFQIPGAFMVAAFMELPTIILALGHMKRSFRSEYLFGFSFFVTRIVFHLYFAWRTFTVWWSVFPAVMILALGTFPLHIYWFGCWVRRQIRIYKKSRSLAARLASAETEDEGVTAASRTTTGTYASLEEAPIIAVLESGSERQSIVSVGERAVLGKTHLVSFAPGYGTISTAASDSDGIRPVTPPNRDEQASRHSRSIPRDSLQIEVVPVYRHSRASTSSLGASVVSQLSFVVSSPNRDGVDPDRLSEEDVEEIVPALLHQRRASHQAADTPHNRHSISSTHSRALPPTPPAPTPGDSTRPSAGM
ncbi:hypothetical protein HK105_202056 [Polyrhizophydium stewartii]|uniref:TLC domain-containing protein n=1 Tax=Polyrhizophydium stewartii TaxID=2732419 RepID=A0ABR4NF14_9FUNG